MVFAQRIDLLTCSCLLLAGLTGLVRGADGLDISPVYVTWDVMEPDKCASIWLIRRHIASDARFQVFQTGDAPPDGIEFDTSEAQFRRTHNRSTFEVLMTHHQIDDFRVRYIGRLIHDLEINTWQRKALPETESVAHAFADRVGFDWSDASVEKCILFFDHLSVP